MAGKVSGTLKMMLELRDRMGGLEGRMDRLESAMGGLATAILDALNEMRAGDVREQLIDHERRLRLLEKRAR